MAELRAEEHPCVGPGGAGATGEGVNLDMQGILNPRKEGFRK